MTALLCAPTKPFQRRVLLRAEPARILQDDHRAVLAPHGLGRVAWHEAGLLQPRQQLLQRGQLPRQRYAVHVAGGHLARHASVLIWQVSSDAWSLAYGTCSLSAASAF